MSDSSPGGSEAASRFLDNYLKRLARAAVPEGQRHWYVRRVEEFIKAHNGRRIKALSGADIAQYFEAIDRRSRLSGWQFRQCIDAIRILCCDLLTSNAGRDMDWRYWHDSAEALSVDHTTTARELSPKS